MTPTPAKAPAAYTLTVGGRSIEHDNLNLSEAEWGGFDSCSFDVKSRPDLHETGLEALAPVFVWFDGESIFEGRVTDPGKTVSADGCTRHVECRGKHDDLKYDAAFRRLFIDSASFARDGDDIVMDSWQDDQTDNNSSKFNVLEDYQTVGGGD